MPLPRTIASGPGESSAGGRLGALAGAIRAGEWWEYKLVPLLGLFYATAILTNRPISSLWEAILLLLLALAPGAAWVSLVNDLTDRRDDAAAGKPNRMLGRSLGFILAAIALPMAAGIVFAWLWRKDGLLLASYLAAWAAFALYSIPPIRLKTRGAVGLIADAAGSNLFPTMVAVILAFRAAGSPVDLPWLAAAGTLAFTWGLRGILWHQLGDVEHDRRAGVRTFVRRHSARAAAGLAKFVIFPVELASLAWLTWQLRDPAPVVALALYAILVWRRLPRYRMRAAVVEPGPRAMIVLQEYYDFFLPLALLLSSSVRYPVDLLVAAVHLLLFPRRFIQIARDSWDLRR